MSTVHIDDEAFVVEAEDLARAFGVHASEIIQGLREGLVTSRCEKGIDEHDGRHRLIFAHQGRVLRLTVDGAGKVLSRAVFARPPAGAPKPGCHLHQPDQT